MACLCAPPIVRAQLDEARARYEEADFDNALAALARAERGSDLDADGVVELFRLRALVHLGMGDQDAMRQDVRALILVRPSVELDATTPPEVLEAADEIRGELAPLTIEASLEPTDEGARIDAAVHGDGADLVRSVRVHTRVAGGSWLTGEPPVSLDVPGGAQLSYRAEAIGPGGAVIAEDGTAASPLTWTSSADVDAGGGGGGSPWLLVGIGGAAAVALGVVLVVVLTSGGENENTQPTLPVALSYGP